MLTTFKKRMLNIFKIYMNIKNFIKLFNQKAKNITFVQMNCMFLFYKSFYLLGTIFYLLVPKKTN